jgi:hypothetical protein
MVKICLNGQPDAKTKAATETKTIERCVVLFQFFRVGPLSDGSNLARYDCKMAQLGSSGAPFAAARFSIWSILPPPTADGRASHIKSRSSVSNRQEFDWVAVRLFPVARRKSSCRARCIKTAVGLASGGSDTHVWCMFARPTHHHRWHKINRRVRFVPATIRSKIESFHGVDERLHFPIALWER